MQLPGMRDYPTRPGMATPPWAVEPGAAQSPRPNFSLVPQGRILPPPRYIPGVTPTGQFVFMPPPAPAVDPNANNNPPAEPPPVYDPSIFDPNGGGWINAP